MSCVYGACDDMLHYARGGVVQLLILLILLCTCCLTCNIAGHMHFASRAAKKPSHTRTGRRPGGAPPDTAQTDSDEAEAEADERDASVSEALPASAGSTSPRPMKESATPGHSTASVHPSSPGESMSRHRKQTEVNFSPPPGESISHHRKPTDANASSSPDGSTSHHKPTGHTESKVSGKGHVMV